MAAFAPTRGPTGWFRRTPTSCAPVPDCAVDAVGGLGSWIGVIGGIDGVTESDNRKVGCSAEPDL